MKYVLLLLMSFVVIHADDAVILKSGRKVEGAVIVKENEVHLIGKYGTIIYNKADVTIQKEGTVKSEVSDPKDKIDPSVVENHIVPKPCQITTRSGRKIIGNVFQKGDDIFFVELDGIVKIDPFVFVKKEELGSNAIKGDAISGERCNVVLKSGRAFSGIVEEVDENYYVSSVLGVVKVAKKDVDHIEKSGSELNLKEALEKLAENGEASNASKTAPAMEAPISMEPNKKAETTKPELTEEEIARINKKAEDALKASKETPKEIKTQHETH